MTRGSITEIVKAAREAIVEVSPPEALRRAKEEGALIIDVRDVRELQREGVAEGAAHAPRGMLEFWFAPDSPYANEDYAQDREYILYCSLGWRSALSTKALQDLGVEKVSHIESGFKGWASDGMPVQDYETWKEAARQAKKAQA